MKHKASLLILAAGMGSRYGGLKQLDSFGPNGETIIDYSIYDAILAGFTKIVFVIRKSFESEFRMRFDELWLGKIELHYVFQELNDLPEPYKCPEHRTKPWGTAHAVWVGKDVINEPFGVINADDYYGRPAIKSLFDALTNGTVIANRYAVIAYHLKNTLSDYGTVNRGVCTKDHLGFLEFIKECKGINKKNNDAVYTEEGIEHHLSLEGLVSMNIWGFDPSYFNFASNTFKEFLSLHLDSKTEEFFIPELIQHLIDSGNAKVAVIASPSQWFGVTYIEDKPTVQNSISIMIEDGYYPESLV
ncbi:MAG: sugar phosphate nucleotidyltransferase [Saprospiraceae bacterium]